MAKKYHWAGWKYLIPGYGLYQMVKNVKDNGYQVGDLSAGLLGFEDTRDQVDSSTGGVLNSAADFIESTQPVVEATTDTLNNHNISENVDQNGYQQVEVTPSDPTSSASNVINYDPNKSAMENMLGYAQANNSASAYNDYLQTAHNTEMSNTALSRAIADAERNGISKYQLFQSGNAAASTPSSGSSLATSYENAMNRRESWNEKELDAIVKIITSTISSALGVLGK